MKKLILIIVTVLLSITFISCDRAGDLTTTVVDSTTTVVDDQTTTQPEATQLSAPTNLRLDGKVLLWDPVANATGYIVYIDGVQEEIVTGTSFDFNHLFVEDMVFTLVAKAGTGYEDSPVSVTLAYTYDRTTEIAAVQAVLDAFLPGSPVGFAGELVDKGMSSQDVQLMISGIQVFQSEMETMASPQEGLVALNSMLDDINNIEAIVSAMVKTVLPGLIQSEIDAMAGATDFETVQLRAALQGILTDIDTNPDTYILAVTNTIEYFLSVEGMITVGFLDQIEAIATSSTAPTGAEMFAVLDEVVNILNTTMPTENETLSVVLMMNSIQTAFGITPVATITDADAKVVDSMLGSAQLFVNFLDTFTATDFDNIINAITNSDPYMTGVEVAIEVLYVVDRYLDEQAAAITALNNVYTEEDKIAIWDGALAQLLSYVPEDDMPNGLDQLLTSIRFEYILDLQIALGEGFDAVLDELLASDGEILRQLVISDGFEQESEFDPVTGVYLGNIYSNYVLDSTYIDGDAYYLARDEVELTIAQYAVELVNAFAQTIDANDVNAVANLIFGDILSGVVTYLDFEAMVTPDQNFDTTELEYMHATANGSFTAPVLEEGEYFSSRWGIALKNSEVYGNEFLEITYIDPASPLLDMRDPMGNTVPLVVGDYISSMYLFDSSSFWGYNLYWWDYAGNVASTLDGYDQIEYLYTVQLGAVPEPFMTTIEATDLLSLAGDLYFDTNANVLALVQNVLQYAADNDFFLTVYDAIEYQKLSGSIYALDITLMQHYYAFMTPSNRILLDSILDEVYIAMKDARVDVLLPYSDPAIDDLDAAIETLLNDLDTQAGLLHAFNYLALLPGSEVILDNFKTIIIDDLDAIEAILNPTP